MNQLERSGEALELTHNRFEETRVAVLYLRRARDLVFGGSDVRDAYTQQVDNLRPDPDASEIQNNDQPNVDAARWQIDMLTRGEVK